MRVQQLNLVNFRNHQQLDLSFTSPLVIIVGDNAVGKTNLIEALQLLSMQESFRRPGWRELVRWQSVPSDPCRITMHYNLPTGVPAHIALRIADGKRAFFHNDKKRGGVELAGMVPAALFSPDDLELAKGQPALRRDLIDGLGARLSRTFASIRRDYRRSLQQKNLLLRLDAPDLRVLESWNQRVAALGASLFVHRLGLYRQLFSNAATIYGHLSGGEQLAAHYWPTHSSACLVAPHGSEPCLPHNGEDSESRMPHNGEIRTLQEDGRPTANESPENGTPPDRCEAREHNTIAAVQTQLEAAIADNWQREKAAHRALIGPHKDRIDLLINGRDARHFGSQGQQRGVALALKMAEIVVLKEVTGAQPMLLLDDVMSELDAGRREQLLKLLNNDTQTFITTTNLNYFDQQTLQRAQLLRLPYEAEQAG
ncbi:MAG: AAA family ATPase [Coriobacteriales bacterium]|jgi:DNA replication and repair protein RecF|nr:AAA family ATPase [Coriobacteriales bacterium]